MPVPFDDDEDVGFSISIKGKQVNRFDAMIRNNEPWEESGPDTRGLRDLFVTWMGRYWRRDVRTYEGNIVAEAVETVDDPT